MTQILNTFTGNAILNNALMTVQALAKTNEVSEISPNLLLRLYKEIGLKNLNKRLKSYTMLFTKNGPLKNDKTNGEKIYDGLFNHILNNFENTGEFMCEISGLRFKTTFENFYQDLLKEIGLTDKDIQRKDITINRSWFPLIGGLGSDAQALPQAKFSVQIHPICVIIMQFLPLSSLLYKGGILLIDSSNFEFARDFVAANTAEVKKRIDTSNSTEPIENIRFNKGSYLLKALNILEEKELEDEYSDLNLWSFSNSGTGANCSIDRVPNEVMKKLIAFRSQFNLGSELKAVLQNSKSSGGFIEALEGNKEWWLLYPNIFKKVPYEGVSVPFIEAYFEITLNAKKISYARYLAGLIRKYKTQAFEKYLIKHDAWNEKEYRIDLFAVLVKATANDEWDLDHHFQILDDAESLPLKNNFYDLHKLTHFYYQKGIFDQLLPPLEENRSIGKHICHWVIGLLEKDDRQEQLIKDLRNVQKYLSVPLNGVFLRAVEDEKVTLKRFTFAFYNQDFFRLSAGLNALLRIYFNQPGQTKLESSLWSVPQDWSIKEFYHQWADQLSSFADDYQAYYFEKFGNLETGQRPVEKYHRLLKDIPLATREFFQWFEEAVTNTNLFLKKRDGILKDKWSDAILYNPYGEISLSFAKPAVKFTLLDRYFQTTTTVNTIS